MSLLRLRQRNVTTKASTSSAKHCPGDDIMGKSSPAKKLARMKSEFEKARSKLSFKNTRLQNSDNASKQATNSLKKSRKSTRNKNVPQYSEQTDSSACEEGEATPTSKINLQRNKKSSSTKAITKRKFTETDANDNMMSSPKKKLRKQPEMVLKIDKVNIENVVSKKPVTKKVASARAKKSAAVSRSKKEKPTTKKKQIHNVSESKYEQPSTSAKIESADNMSDSDSDVEWEEVEELPDVSPRKAPLQVTLESNVRKSKRDKIVAYAKMLWNRYQRKIHESVHKVELMCLLTHGRMVNEVCNSPLLRALIMSVHSSTNLKGNKCTMKSVQSFISNLIKRFSLSDKQYLASQTNLFSLEEDLSTALQTYEVKCETHLVLLIIAILRFVGATVRLCVAWNPITFKIAQYQKKERLRKNGSEQALPEVTTKSKKRKKGKLHDSGSDSDESSTKTSKRTMKGKCKDQINYQSYWLEVYFDKKWVPVECTSVKLDDVQAISSRLIKPMTYIISFNNPGKVKDVSARYDPEWMLSTRKQRVEQSWWDEMIKPYHVKESKQTREEDQEILNKLANMPFPKTIGGFKDHPLYALERHLLKFEAIYPSTAVPLGYTEKKSEPIYARSCVKTLHTRETWLKEAKQVKLGEQPYKFVKPRPKMNEKTKITKATQPVFGYWQTEPYVPPIAENGKVPRNAYGNVDFFKPEMIPVGCAHIPINGVGKLARKLDIDCAQAMIGWDIHGGFTCPVFDGWIVCEEHKQIILDAWEEFEAEERRKEQVKKEKIIYGKWKTLIKGLLIRERLRNRYGTENF